MINEEDYEILLTKTIEEMTQEYDEIAQKFSLLLSETTQKYKNKIKEFKIINNTSHKIGKNEN